MLTGTHTNWFCLLSSITIPSSIVSALSSATLNPAGIVTVPSVTVKFEFSVLFFISSFFASVIVIVSPVGGVIGVLSPATVVVPFASIVTLYPSTVTVAGKFVILLLSVIALPLYFNPLIFGKFLFN